MSGDSFNRRNVLKKFGASAAAAAALGTGTASAETTGDYEQRYQDRDARRAAVEAHAGDVLEALAERDIIDEPSVDVFDLETEAANRSIGSETTAEGYAIGEFVDEERGRTADLELSTSPDGYDLSVYVRPEFGESYALVQPEDGEKFAIDPTTEKVKLESSSSCDDFCDCGVEVCNLLTMLHNANFWECYQSYDRCRCYKDHTECGCDPLVGC